MHLINKQVAAVLAVMALATAPQAMAQDTEAAETAQEPVAAPADAAPETTQQDAAVQPVAEMSAGAPAEASTIAVQELHPEEPELPAEPGSEVTALESVEVTASYRKENIQDVTGSAQAFSGRALDKAGVVGMDDYLRQVPSVSLQKSGNGKANIAMRGISNINANDTGYAAGSPTVGVYINDVGIQGSGVFPDLNIFDLQRIEVLKGPQGTLYGEGSMGGAIRMITNAPSTERWEARAEGSYSVTEGGKPSHDIRAAVNVPIGETLAARAVGSVRNTGGFVDYTTLGREDANSVDASSLRGTASWKPTGTLEFEYMYLRDKEFRDQFPIVDPGSEEEMENAGKENQFALTDFTINALTTRWTLPFANLTSVTAFYNTDRDTQRRTPVLQSLIETQLGGQGLTAPPIFTNSPMRTVTELQSFSQELRLVSFGGDTFDWIAGAFYRDRSQTFDQEKREDAIPDDPTGILTALLGGFNPIQGRQEQGGGEETFGQEAIYGELTWNVIPSKFEITGGLRAFQEEVAIDFNTKFYGLEAYLLATDPANIVLADRSVRKSVNQSIKTSGILPKLSLGWHFNEDHMAYAMISRGFRSGAANIYAALDSGPPLIQPDYVWNKEIGTKSTWLDGRLITNLAAYHIDWTDVQGALLGKANLGIVPVDFAHLDNAGDAVVMGAEGSVMWTPAQGLLLLGSVGYNEGHISRPAPGSGTHVDGRMPNTPRLTWSGTSSYSFPLFDMLADVSATYTFVGDQISIYEVEGAPTPEAAAGFPLDSFGLFKASFAVRHGNFRVQLFGDNLMDKRVVTAKAAPIPQWTINTPRIIGIRAGYEF